MTLRFRGLVRGRAVCNPESAGCELPTRWARGEVAAGGQTGTREFQKATAFLLLSMTPGAPTPHATMELEAKWILREREGR